MDMSPEPTEMSPIHLPDAEAIDGGDDATAADANSDTEIVDAYDALLDAGSE
jgi:hypothetical protein